MPRLPPEDGADPVLRGRGHCAGSGDPTRRSLTRKEKPCSQAKKEDHACLEHPS